jgi:hypothetical protein
MEFSRHARQSMKLYKISRDDVMAVLDSPRDTSEDLDGNPIFDGVVGDRVIRVVIPKDNPNRVKTTFPRRK